MKKNLLLTILILSLVLLSYSQIRLKKPVSFRKVPPKVMVIGDVVFWEFPSYVLSSNLIITYNNKPLKTLKLYLNNEPFRNFHNGTYEFQRKKYRLKLGMDLVLYAESRNVLNAPFRGKVELARYKINNLIRYIYPRKNQVIDLSTSPQNILLKWDFVNYSGPVLLKLYLPSSQHFIVQEAVSGGQYSLAKNLLTPSTIYQMIVKTTMDALLGYFKLSKYVQQGSKIRFKYKGGMQFQTK